jgi:hypothetical protein
MAITLTQMRDHTEQITVAWQDETVDVGYHPGVLTPALLEQASEAGKAGDLNQVGNLLSPLLSWWDVLDDEGNRLPTDARTIATIPFTFTMAIMDAITEAMRPPARKG